MNISQKYHNGFRVPSLENAINFLNKENLQNNDIYQFGVWFGTTLLYLHDSLKDKGLRYNNLYGFDSFRGFPDMQQEKTIDPSVWQGWIEMDLNLVNGSWTVEKIKENISSSFIKKPILIDGFYEDSLQDEIVQKFEMRPAALISVDCDLYTSTKTALDFMFRNKLIVPGTIIVYDEWGEHYNRVHRKGHTEIFGEERAHIEMSKKYGEFELLLYETDKAIFIKK